RFVTDRIGDLIGYEDWTSNVAICSAALALDHTSRRVPVSWRASWFGRHVLSAGARAHRLGYGISRETLLELGAGRARLPTWSSRGTSGGEAAPSPDEGATSVG
ncbi:unnamed protein product, partial [Prorocentrum cordatum]